MSVQRGRLGEPNQLEHHFGSHSRGDLHELPDDIPNRRVQDIGSHRVLDEGADRLEKFANEFGFELGEIGQRLDEVLLNLRRCTAGPGPRRTPPPIAGPA